MKFYKTKLVALGAMKQLKNSCSSNANYVKIGKNEVKEKKSSNIIAGLKLSLEISLERIFPSSEIYKYR